jgi:hypothetical protein
LITNPNGPASAYTATINWGRGGTSIGTIQVVPEGLEVLGSHVYKGRASSMITVTVDGPGGYTAVATTLATAVPRRPPHASRVHTKSR